MTHIRIHRYILREVLTPALFSLFIFSFVLLMGRIPQLTELVINKGVPVTQIFALFGYLMPTFLTITLPLSFLLGILLAFGRLSADSEYIALKACGISLYTILKPVLILSVIFALFTGTITMFIEPASKAAFRSILFKIASSSGSLAVSPGVFNDQFDGLVIYAQGVDEQRGILQDIFISDGRPGEIPSTIVARQGYIIANPDSLKITLHLDQGSIHRIPEQKDKQAYQILSFNNYDLSLALGSQLDDKSRHISRNELSWQELRQAISTEPSVKKRNQMAVELHQRIVIAFAPIVLVLVGAPLGLQSQRSGKGAGFSLALVVFLAYYVLLSLAGTIAEKDILPAGLILWLPNLCFLSGGLFFLKRAAEERPFRPVHKLQKQLTQYLNHRRKQRIDS